MLILALVLVATFGLLAWSLLASTDLAGRARGAALAQQQAERAAASGVEWAAAKLLAGDLDEGRTDLVLDCGSELQVLFSRTGSPQVLARARSQGAEFTVGADLRTEAGAPLPYALAVFGSSLSLHHDVVVSGSAYLAGDPPIATGATGKLGIAGDLLLTAAAIDASRVRQTTGATSFSVEALAKPVVDLTPFGTLTSGAVPVLRYSGPTTLSGQTLTGLVVVDLEVGQTLLLRNTTIDGTLVVRTFSAGLLGVGGGLLGTGVLPAVVRLQGSSQVGGGTAWTGNLALLAPDCTLDGPASNGSTLRGVVLVQSAESLKKVDVTGQLVVFGMIEGDAAGLTVTRPDTFVPDTPLGITWPGSAAVRLDWRGPQ